MSNPKMLFLFTLFFISFAYSASYPFNNTPTCSATQAHALLLFKQDTFSIDDIIDEYHDYRCRDRLGSDYNSVITNWKTSIDCCNWDGVTCNHFTGDVIALDLSCANLKGTIHPNTTLFHLPHLQRLNLAFNDFRSSQFPREIGNTLTHLNISDCWFTGQFPTSFHHKWVSLDLSFNFFTLEPHALNNLLQNSTSLRDLTLSGVNISSALPTYVNISSSLKLLELSGTGLHGKLPDYIFNLQYLETLDLQYNFGLTGSLPEVNNTSTSIPLKWLYLRGSSLSGEIPYSIGHLKSLNTLDLSNCGLMGPLPKSIVNLWHLKTLNLADNKLNGTLPSLLFSLPSLETLDLSANNFSGSLPSQLFNHQSLKKLYLGENQFVGKIDMLDQDSTVQAFWKVITLTTLDLSFNNFIGVWELDTLLSRLTNITYLDLSYSGLSVVTNNDAHYVNPNFQMLGLAACKLNVFPKSLRAMKNLIQLDLSNNGIIGHIPDWAGEIGGNELYHLNLSHNSITSLPQFQWATLNVLDLQTNLIQGSFPPSIRTLGNLLYLDMSNNNFSGEIPQWFSFNSLQMVDLGNNSFHGTIPIWDGSYGNLAGLILKENHLEGEVPRGLSEHKSLTVLDLGNNHLNGTFPHWLGNLSYLQVLVLKSNKLHGPINSSSMIKNSFPSLKVLDLSQNEFEGQLCGKYFQNFDAMKNVKIKGTIPQYLRLGPKFYSITVAVKGSEREFPKFLVDYTIVDLSGNKLEGEIPNEICTLNSLIVLNLSNNNLNGQIPHAIGNLSQIQSLDLSWNQLTGKIPQSLADITYLEVLNLSQNHLVGRIPAGTQLSTFNASFSGNPGLCGPPLPVNCERPSSPQAEEADGDDDEASGFTWKVVMLGYGCGTLLGLVMGYLMLSTGRPKWFNAIADEIEHMIQTKQKKRRKIIYIGK